MEPGAEVVVRLPVDVAEKVVKVLRGRREEYTRAFPRPLPWMDTAIFEMELAIVGVQAPAIESGQGIADSGTERPAVPRVSSAGDVW